jgi:hypothetical protein
MNTCKIFQARQANLVVIAFHYSAISAPGSPIGLSLPDPYNEESAKAFAA